jgi:hypothetical protein
MHALWPVLVLAACTTSSPVLAPIIDQPVNADASAFPFDTLEMDVAHNGSATDLESATFMPGQTPALGGIPFADDLVVYLTGSDGQQTAAYGRTCAVAVTAGGPVPQPHLYFSKIVEFGQLTQTPASVRLGGSAMTDGAGGDVVLGGVDSAGNPVAEVERFDPLTGTLTPRYASLGARTGPAVAALGSGTSLQFVVVGGLDPATSAGAQFLELVSPQESTPEQRVCSADDARMARLGLTATALGDGSLIVIGGQLTPPVATATPGEVDIVVPATPGCLAITEQHAMLQIPRAFHTATRLGDYDYAPVLIVGGIDGSGNPVAQAEIYEPLEQSFSSVFKPLMVQPRSQHQALEMSDTSVLIVGGLDGSGSAATDLELFTVEEGFRLIGQLPADPTLGSAGVVDFATTTLPDGSVLMTGGRLMPGGSALDTAYIARVVPGAQPPIEPVELVPTARMTTPRAGHQATLLCDGTVLLSGGTDSPVPDERYNPFPR